MPTAPPLLGPDRQPYLGLSEIADLCGAEKGTAWRWQQRGVLPAPDFLVSERTPAWARERIMAWATRTGRIKIEPAAAEAVEQPATP
jgi:predicted DNA-binding transcriptional regulator AlpA